MAVFRGAGIDPTGIRDPLRSEIYPATKENQQTMIDLLTTISTTGISVALDYATDSVTAHQGGTWNINEITTLPAITGSVTANAGTNLNTSALALETTATSIKNAVETIDNAISGNEMQVDVVGALPSGTNNIGDVDVASIISTVSTNNSSTTPLAGDGVFTGTADEVTNYAQVVISAFSNVASASGGLSLQESSDGTNWDEMHTHTVSAGDNLTIHHPVHLKYFRVVYTNGATIQASFRLQTILKTIPAVSEIQPLGIILDDTDMASTTRAILSAKTPGGSYVNVDCTAGGNLKVAVEEFDTDLPDTATGDLAAINANTNGIEGLLTTIDADTSVLAGKDFATQTTLASILAGQLPDGHNVTVDNASIAVTGTFWQATQPVSATNLDIRDLANATDSVAIYGSDDGGTTKRIIKTDSGGAIQVDLEVASVTVTSGNITADTELTTADLDTGAGTDTRAVVGLVGTADGGGQLIPGSATDGLLVNLGSNNDVVVSATNLDIRDLTSVSDSISAVQSGTWNIGTVTAVTSITNPVAVTGTFWQATQPISAASLPLPTGASTLAEQQSQTTHLATIAGDTTSIDGKTPALGQAAMAASVPVVIANNQSQVPVGTTAGATTVGFDTLFDSDGDNTAQQCKAGAGNIYTLHIVNTNTANAYLQLFDVATAGVTVGTTVPKQSYLVIAGGGLDLQFPVPMTFATAITYACTTTATGAGDPTTGLIVNIGYK